MTKIKLAEVKVEEYKVPTLNDLLSGLASEQAGPSDIKEALIAYVLETEDDPTDQKAHRARLRLEALKVLADLVKKAAIALLDQLKDIDMDKVHAVQIAIIMDKHSKPSVASSDEDKEDDPTKDPSKKEEGSDGLPSESCKECGSDDCECNKEDK
jgi:hypothetical protein